MLASQIYARSQGSDCQGNRLCHWCGSNCTDKLIHDDPLPIPFSKARSTAKVGSSPYVCNGCWLYRRPRITVMFLNQSKETSPNYKDRQAPCNHSWIITPDYAHALRKEDFGKLYEFLLKPECCFSLSLLTVPKMTNLLHLMMSNDLKEIKADTTLHFTLNNIPHSYSPYELEHYINTRDDAGLMSGIRALIEFTGLEALPKPIKEEEEKRGRGRPSGGNSNIPNPGKKTIRAV